MSKLEELIKELCPDGVEYKTLGELGKFYSGLSGKTKDDFTDGNEKFITYMNVFSNISIKVDVKDFVKISKGEKQNTIQYGDVIFTGSSETPNECGMSSVLTIKTCEKLYLNSFCFGFRFFDSEIYNPDFSKYMFRSINLRKQIVKTASGVTRFNVSKKKMEKVRIPILPLAIQQEIVRILENLTDVTEKIKTKLQEEITARKKQYEYYRNSLLNLSEKEPFIELGDIAEFKYGYTDKAKDKGEARFIRITDIGNDCKLKETDCKYVNLNEESQQYLLEKDDLLMARTGATYGKTMLYDDYENSAIYASFLIRIRFPQKEVDPRYYWHFSQSDLYWYQADRLVNKAGQPQFNANVLKLVKLQVPSLNEQEKIVCILDRYNSIYNEIIKKISDEIEARQKQYEYYRDKLLSFKELKKEGV